jgi:hypothetical protein
LQKVRKRYEFAVFATLEHRFHFGAISGWYVFASTTISRNGMPAFL